MWKKLSLMAVLLVLPLVAVGGESQWSGTDGKAEEKIGEIAPHYEPWASPLWEPPSSEVESLLFSLQAALGALAIGYFIGYYRGREKNESKV